ncbi:hypothetical protein Lal_00023155 [Lupinus albus]|nr:hypothetical protein Lal_00023155 [Lupinus albus]
MTEIGKPPDSVSSASHAPCPNTKVRQPRSESHDTSVTILGTPRSDDSHDTHDSAMPHTWHVSPTIAQSILWMDRAHEVWDELRKRFSQGNLFRIAELQESIANLKQGDLSVTSYFTELKIMWDELDNFRPLPKCSCEIPCTCDALVGVRTHRTEDRVIRFLRRLNDSYASVRSQIMLIEPMPNMRRVFSLVVQQERQLGNADNEGRALAVGTNWRGESSSDRNSNFGRGKGSFRGNNSSNKASSAKNGKLCTHCRKPGHTMDICYRLHGFPANFKFTRNQHTNSATTTNQDQIHERGNDPHIGFNEEEYRRLQNMPTPTRNTNEHNTSTILSTMAPDVNDNSEEGLLTLSILVLPLVLPPLPPPPLLLLFVPVFILFLLFLLAFSPPTLPNMAALAS